jgi:hypothetical protein
MTAELVDREDGSDTDPDEQGADDGKCDVSKVE